MNRIANAVGVLIAMMSLKSAPAPMVKSGDELLLDRLMTVVEPDFASLYPDQGDQSFKQG